MATWDMVSDCASIRCVLGKAKHALTGAVHRVLVKIVDQIYSTVAEATGDSGYLSVNRTEAQSKQTDKLKSGSFIDTSSGKPKRFLGVLRHITSAGSQGHFVFTLSPRRLDAEDEEERPTDRNTNEHMTFLLAHIHVGKYLGNRAHVFKIVDIEDSYEIRLLYTIQDHQTHAFAQKVSDLHFQSLSRSITAYNADLLIVHSVSWHRNWS